VVSRVPLSASELTECQRSGDAVDLKMAGGLKAPYRSTGRRPVASVDRPRWEARSGKLTLQGPDRSRSPGDVSIAST
jgi:hypothetical protein